MIGTASILRSIFEMSLALPGAVVGVAPQHNSMGITIMTNDAFFAVASPDPEGDFQQSWYYWNRWQTTFPTVAQVQRAMPMVDLRSSRRLRSGFKLVMVNETPATNTVAFEVHIAMRNLWRLG